MRRVNKYRGMHVHVLPQNEHLKGTWIYGYLADENYINSPELEGEFLVDKNTVGQYIGVDDKNGNEIYEGDIVKIHQFLFDGCEYEKEIIVSIEYMEEMACFGANLLQAEEIRRYMGYDYWDKEKVVIPLCNFYGLHGESFEVIGNVHENADLLKGVDRNE